VQGKVVKGAGIAQVVACMLVHPQVAPEGTETENGSFTLK